MCYNILRVSSLISDSRTRSNSSLSVVVGVIITLFILVLIIVGVLLYRRHQVRKYVSDHNQMLLNFYSQSILPASVYFLCKMYKMCTCPSKIKFYISKSFLLSHKVIFILIVLCNSNSYICV